MEETISLQDIFKIIKKRLVIIIIITFASTMVSALYTSFFITPKYEASTQILVNQASNDQSQYNLNQIQTNVQYINTYSVIIKSPTVLRTVIDKLHLDMTANDLKDILTVNSEQNSQVFTVTVQEADPAKAVKIANAVANVFKYKISTIMKVDNVSILSKAQLSNDAAPVSPKPKLNMAIAFVVGLMVSIGLSFLLDYLDNTVKTEEDIESFLGLPFLGAIAETNFEEVKLLSTTRSRKPVGGEDIEA